MKYKIEITEILQRTVEIDAEYYSDAIIKVKKMYYKEHIILNEKDLIETTFEVLEDKK